ncbi:hypothetical protein F5X99DRAFT_15143 [Biscogniauxia marginata]|nr:hypothetical protein F5X99DRAFT_15143 [Biscogniauxia marginata]
MVTSKGQSPEPDQTSSNTMNKIANEGSSCESQKGIVTSKCEQGHENGSENSDSDAGNPPARVQGESKSKRAKKKERAKRKKREERIRKERNRQQVKENIRKEQREAREKEELALVKAKEEDEMRIEHSKALEQLESTIEGFHKRIATLTAKREHEAIANTSRAIKLEAEVEKIRGNSERDKATLTETQIELNRAEKIIEELREQTSANQTDKAALIASQSELAKAKVTIRELEGVEQRGKLEHQEQLEKVESELREHQNISQQNKKALDASKSELEQARKENHELEASIKKEREIKTSAQNELEKVKTRLADMEVKRGIWQREKAVLEAEITKLKSVPILRKMSVGQSQASRAILTDKVISTRTGRESQRSPERGSSVTIANGSNPLKRLNGQKKGSDEGRGRKEGSPIAVNDTQTMTNSEPKSPNREDKGKQKENPSHETTAGPSVLVNNDEACLDGHNKEKQIDRIPEIVIDNARTMVYFDPDNSGFYRKHLRSKSVPRRNEDDSDCEPDTDSIIRRWSDAEVEIFRRSKAKKRGLDDFALSAAQQHQIVHVQLATVPINHPSTYHSEPPQGGDQAEHEQLTPSRQDTNPLQRPADQPEGNPDNDPDNDPSDRMREVSRRRVELLVELVGVRRSIKAIQDQQRDLTASDIRTLLTDEQRDGIVRDIYEHERNIEKLQSRRRSLVSELNRIEKEYWRLDEEEIGPQS